MSPDRPASEPRSLRLEFRAVFATFLFASLLPLLGGFACAEDREKAQRRREAVEEAPPRRPESSATPG